MTETLFSKYSRTFRNLVHERKKKKLEKQWPLQRFGGRGCHDNRTSVEKKNDGSFKGR